MLAAFRSLLLVARSGSVRAASEASGLAPSSVSRQILVLEQQIGTALLVRTPAGASLTAAGERVADFANDFVLDYDRLRADLNDARGVGKVRIRLGVIESMASGDVMSVVAELRAQQPNIVFSVQVMRAPDIAAAVRQGVCDIGIALDITPTPDIRIIGRVPETLVVAIHPDHEAASRERVRLADLTAMPLALHEPDHGVRQMIDRACRMQGVILDPVLSSNSLEALRDFVRIGAGATLVTRRGIRADLERGTMVAVSIAEDALVFEGLTIFASARRRSSRLARLCEVALVRRLRAAQA